MRFLDSSCGSQSRVSVYRRRVCLYSVSRAPTQPVTDRHEFRSPEIPIANVMIRACAFLALLVLLLVAVWQRVYYQTYALDAAPMTTSSGVRIQVSATGTEEILKRRTGDVARNGSPYRLGLYVDRRTGEAVEVLDVTLVGQRSGTVSTPVFAAPEPVGDGSLTVVSVAPGVELPFEDHHLRLRIRMGAGADAVIEEVTGTITATYEERGAFRFWEEWMSV